MMSTHTDQENIGTTNHMLWNGGKSYISLP